MGILPIQWLPNTGSSRQWITCVHTWRKLDYERDQRAKRRYPRLGHHHNVFPASTESLFRRQGPRLSVRPSRRTRVRRFVVIVPLPWRLSSDECCVQRNSRRSSSSLPWIWSDSLLPHSHSYRTYCVKVRGLIYSQYRRLVNWRMMPRLLASK